MVELSKPDLFATVELGRKLEEMLPIEDIESICEYIANDSLYYVKLFGNRVFDIVENIGKFPQMGRTVPEMNQEKIRKNIFGNDCKIYRLHENKVEILSVHHSVRLLNVQKILIN